MKRIFTLLLLSLFCLGAQAQLVISEISYNPPESGNDSLEYIEIYNDGPLLDLEGYTLTGADHVFPAGSSIAQDEIIVLAKSASAMQAVYGITAIQWDDGALSNGGEEITISDASGTLLDVVNFDDEAPWPGLAEGTDGEGASIEVCNAVDNSVGANWRAADNDLGISLNGKDLKGTPGSANTVVCEVTADHTIMTQGLTFVPADITINVNETVEWVNTGGGHNVNGTTATYPNNPEGFDNGAVSSMLWTFEHTFTIVGVYDYQCDPHTAQGMVGKVTVIDPNASSYPVYTIGTVTTTDADGVADSLGVTCTLVGTIHTLNFNPAGLTYTILDDTNNGIGIYNQNDNFGGNFNLGDEVTIEGEITQFRGLTQIDVATMSVTGSNALFDPTIVTALNESTESQIIEIANLSYVDAAAWVPDGSGFNMEMTDGTNNFTMRIDGDTEMFNEATAYFPCTGTTTFNYIRGAGGQFDFDVPLDGGYQFFPRTFEDFACTSSNDDLSKEGSIAISPNPVSNVLFIDTEVEISDYTISDLMGRKLISAQYKNSIDVSGLNQGTYFLSLMRGDKIYTSKFVK